MTPDETMREAARLLRGGAVPFDEFVASLSDPARSLLLRAIIPTLSGADRESVVSMLVGREAVWYCAAIEARRSGHEPYLIPSTARELRRDALAGAVGDLIGGGAAHDAVSPREQNDLLAAHGYSIRRLRVRRAT